MKPHIVKDGCLYRMDVPAGWWGRFDSVWYGTIRWMRDVSETNRNTRMNGITANGVMVVQPVARESRNSWEMAEDGATS